MTIRRKRSAKAVVKPVKNRIPEGKGNLKARDAAWKKRHGKGK